MGTRTFLLFFFSFLFFSYFLRFHGFVVHVIESLTLNRMVLSSRSLTSAENRTCLHEV